MSSAVKQFYDVGLEEDYLLWAIHSASNAKDQSRFNPSLLSGERAALGLIIAQAWSQGHALCTALVENESAASEDKDKIHALWAGLSASSPTPAGAEWLEGKLSRLSALRLAKAKLEGIHAMVMAGKELSDIVEAFDLSASAVRGVTSPSAPGQIFTGLQPAYEMHDVVEAMQWRQKNPGLLRGAATGFSKLDSLMDGLKVGDFVIIGARPSVGKTALATCMMAGLGQRGTGSAIFSLEMMAIQIRVRLLSAMSLRNPLADGLTRTDLVKIQDSARTLKGYNIWIDDTDRISISEIQSKARALVRDHGIKVLFIDYLQLVRGVRPESKKDRRIEVGEVSGKLKALAKELKIAIVGMAQLTRSPQSYNSTTQRYTPPRPSLQSLKESGDLEQDADIVLLLHRDIDNSPIDAELIVAKNRSGPTGSVDLAFIPDITAFEESQHNRYQQ
jgi:replicative DNA helicase